MAPEDPDAVRWRPLIAQSLRFLFIEHAFRFATEPATRGPGKPFFKGYGEAATSLHGWADGDPFLVNYIGHPMAGSIAGYLWVQNDGRYRRTEFGKDPAYWKSRLRAAGYAWIYSTQFEIGPISEASLGNIQAFFPQQGFVDHVVTPTMGLGWMLAEDALDRYVIRWFEERTDNAKLKILVRGWLNPGRSMANMMAGRYPWSRDTRPGVLSPELALLPEYSDRPPKREYPAEAPFEFTLAPKVLIPLGGDTGPCVGGGGTAAFRLSPDMQWLVDVGGCKQTGMKVNLSGDNLIFLTGPRWSMSPASKWNPYVQVMVGGMQATTEEMFPAKKEALEEAMRRVGQPLTFTDHAKYTQGASTAGFAVSFGAGIEKKLNSALALRVASLDYTHAWMNRLDSMGPTSNLQIGTGLVLRMGTW